MLEKHSSLVNYGGLAFGDRGEYRYLFGVIKLSYFSNGKKKKKEKNQFRFSIIMKVPETSLFNVHFRPK